MATSQKNLVVSYGCWILLGSPVHGCPLVPLMPFMDFHIRSSFENLVLLS